MSRLPGVPEHGSQRRLLADAVVRVLREMTGRGATRARSIISDDVAMVVLYDSLTKGEKTLVDRGYHARTLAYRHAIQVTMQAEVVAAAQQVLGREVLAFMSTNDVDPDYSCEIFILGGQLEL